MQVLEKERSDWEAARRLSRDFEALQEQERADFVLAHLLAGRPAPPPTMAPVGASDAGIESSSDGAGPSTGPSTSTDVNSERGSPTNELVRENEDFVQNRPPLSIS